MTSELIIYYKKICRTMIRPIVTYACETWTLSIRDINKFSDFERQILRKIIGPTGSKEG
jgi:hypothetical protein